VSIQKAIEVNVSTNRVWPYFIEPDKIMQWCITFKRFEYTSNQHSGVGTPIFIEEHASGQVMKMNFEVIDWKENEKMALRMVSGANLKSYQLSWSLEITPSGCRVSFIEELELPFGVIGKLVSLIQDTMSKATIDKMLVKLKTLVET